MLDLLVQSWLMITVALLLLLVVVMTVQLLVACVRRALARMRAPRGARHRGAIALHDSAG